MRRSKAKGTRQFAVEFQKTCDLLAGTRPTAVNLFWAIDRMKRAFAEAAHAGGSVEEIAQRLTREATPSTTRTWRAAGPWARFGAALVPSPARILTHCNAGALATAGYGTALGVVRGAVERGIPVEVFADETRPFLQGARLTAWELVRDGIATTVIADNMAGALMRQGRVNFVVVGRRPDRGQRRRRQQGRHVHRGPAGARARRAVLRGRAALDDRPRDAGRQRIPIEERDRKEVTHVGTMRLTPEGAGMWNPAFDVTPARPGVGDHHGARRRARTIHRVAARRCSRRVVTDDVEARQRSTGRR